MDRQEMKQKKMMGAILPGNSTVELREFEMPKPGHGQVVVKAMATTICGSDIRCIYREHVGKGPEGYIPGTVAGHEPCGLIVEEGEGLKRFKKGDRVIIYHISGCGVCNDCRRGYYISCKSKFRQAYGWQRNGGMAQYILADEKDLIALPDELTYKDGALYCLPENTDRLPEKYRQEIYLSVLRHPCGDRSCRSGISSDRLGISSGSLRNLV